MIIWLLLLEWISDLIRLTASLKLLAKMEFVQTTEQVFDYRYQKF